MQVLIDINTSDLPTFFEWLEKHPDIHLTKHGKYHLAPEYAYIIVRSTKEVETILYEENLPYLGVIGPF